MPCYTVNLIEVEFKGKNKRFLEMALKGLDYAYDKMKDLDIYLVSTGYSRSIEINLQTGKVTATSSQMDQVNRIKRAYSASAVIDATRKKKWMANQKGNKIYLKKY